MATEIPSSALPVSDAGFTRIDVHGLIGSHTGCRLDIAFDGRMAEGVGRCTCFDAALALADAILGGAS